MLYAERLLHRKMVGTPGTDGRRRLGTQHETLRQLFVAILVTESAVIDSRNIQLGRKTDIETPAAQTTAARNENILFDIQYLLIIFHKDVVLSAIQETFALVVHERQGLYIRHGE